MKIGIEISGIDSWRGPARSTLNLVKALAEIDRRNEYYLFTRVPFDQTTLFNNNFSVVYVPKKKLVPWINFTLPRQLSKRKVDVFIFPYEDFWLWKKVKTIIIVRQAQIYPWSHSMADRLNAWIKQRRLKYVADKVVTISHFSASQLELVFNIPQDDISVICNGVDPSFAGKGARMSNDYGDYILFVGGTDKRKNMDSLLKAHNILIRKRIIINLVIVGGPHGSGPPIEEKMELVKALGSREWVKFHGIERSTERLMSLYKGAKAVVYPSYQETFGNISLEAMASGVPLVASNAPSIPEIAGDAAIYFDPYDVEDIAEKIERVLIDNDLRERLVAKGRERVKKYSWKNSARKLMDLIETVMKES